MINSLKTRLGDWTEQSIGIPHSTLRLSLYPGTVRESTRIMVSDDGLNNGAACRMLQKFYFVEFF